MFSTFLFNLFLDSFSKKYNTYHNDNNKGDEGN